MDKENGIKLALAGAMGLFGAYFQVLVVPLFILIAVMIADYITGMIKASTTNQLNSKKGLAGILKKLCYLFIVAGAMVVDYLIKSSLLSAGVILPESFTIALLVIFWLVINELISILENVAIIGVPMPAWLIKLVKKLRVVAENKGEELTKGDN